MALFQNITKLEMSSFLMNCSSHIFSSIQGISLSIVAGFPKILLTCQISCFRVTCKLFWQKNLTQSFLNREYLFLNRSFKTNNQATHCNDNLPPKMQNQQGNQKSPENSPSCKFPLLHVDLKTNTDSIPPFFFQALF